MDLSRLLSMAGSMDEDEFSLPVQRQQSQTSVGSMHSIMSNLGARPSQDLVCKARFLHVMHATRTWYVNL